MMTSINNQVRFVFSLELRHLCRLAKIFVGLELLIESEKANENERKRLNGSQREAGTKKSFENGKDEKRKTFWKDLSWGAGGGGALRWRTTGVVRILRITG